MVFSDSASMQQDPPALIANDDGYGAVPQSVLVRVQLGRSSDRKIVGIDDDYVI